VIGPAHAMKYIIIDLEWNGAPLYKTGGYFNEIIEIGAVRLDEELRQIDTFQALVQPKIHKKLTGRVKRLTHISNDEVRNARRFKETYRDFQNWLGSEENCVLTWGSGDILVLLENFEQLGIKNGISSIHNYCDAQAICQRALDIDSSKQPGLSAVAEQLGIECGDMEMHRALDDSIVSAECLRRAWKQELFDELRSRVDEEFIRRITFKTVIISDIKNPLIDRNLFRQRCPECGSRMRRTGAITSRNRGFSVDYHCSKCNADYVGRHQFKLKYEGMQHKCLLRTREELEAIKREEAQKAARAAEDHSATTDEGDNIQMNNKKTVAVLFGGRSSEHEVSRTSATMVINNVPADKYNTVMVGITRDGRWYLYEGDVALLADGSWENSGKLTPAFISPDTATHGLVVMRESGVETIYVDVVFPMLHGKNGEDGTMQGLLELAGIPYVGCDCASSAVCMDKALTNTLLEFGGIPQAKFIWFTAADWAENSQYYTDRIDSELGYPCFVKPANAGSSVGISKCRSRDELAAAIELAAANDFKIVIEEGVDGAEVETAVLGNSDGEITVSTVGEIVPAADWYDYDAKYNNAESELHIPGRLSDETMALIKERARKAYRILGCSGLTRMDFFVRRSDGEVMLNEPNTLPGFTPISMYPKLMAFDGIDNTTLVDRLLTLAVERMNGKNK